MCFFFFFQAEDGIRYLTVTGVQTCALPILRDDVGYQAIQAINGVGKTMAAIFVAEIGDISRFPSPDRLCSWAGLTPKHRESDVKVRRGKITKQGSALVRWAAVEAVAYVREPKLKADFHRIG